MLLEILGVDMANPKIIIIFGTRPEIIKLSSIIKFSFQMDNPDIILLHTGQHYSYELDIIFFEELNLPPPRYNLHNGSAPAESRPGKCS